MGLMDAIYRGTHTRVSPTGPVPSVLPVDPATGKPIAAPGVPAPEAVTTAPAAGTPPTKPGLLSTIGSVLAPEAGSFWSEANQHGIFGAKEGMQDYADGQADIAEKRRSTATAQATAETTAAQAQEDATFDDTAAGGVVWRRDPKTGAYSAVTTPVQQPVQASENERLIEMWKNTPPGGLRDLIERAIRGAQYDPDYVEADTSRKLKIKRATPGKAPSSGGSRKAAAPAPPAGFE